MDGIVLGFAIFSSHRTNSWNYVLFFFTNDTELCQRIKLLGFALSSG